MFGGYTVLAEAYREMTAENQPADLGEGDDLDHAGAGRLVGEGSAMADERRLGLVHMVMEWDDLTELQWWQSLTDEEKTAAEASPEEAERLRRRWAGPAYGGCLVPRTGPGAVGNWGWGGGRA